MSTQNATNTEFTRKLRAAVKAKLEEFGLDVDEELPDYVMIMVGNKKDKSRMKSELKLFLGDNTSPFVDWLFGFFQKVKSVTASVSEENAKAVEKKAKPDQSESVSTSKSSEEKPKSGKEKPGKKEVVVERTTKAQPEVQTRQSRREPSPVPKQRIVAPPSPRLKDKKKDSSRHKPIEAPKAKEGRRSKKRTSSSSKHYEEYLTNSDYEDEEEELTPKSYQKPKIEAKGERTERSSKRKKRGSKEPSPKRERMLMQALPKREDRTKDITPPHHHSSKHSRVLRQAEVKRERESEVSDDDDSPPPVRRNIRSQVVVQGSFETPPTPKLSSKVVVIERKNERQSRPEIQGNSSIFKRAISDASSFPHSGHRREMMLERVSKEEQGNVHLDYDEEEKPQSRHKSYRAFNYDQANDEKSSLAKNTRIIVTVNNSDSERHRSKVTIKQEDDEEEEDEVIQESEEVVKGSDAQEERSEEQLEEERSDVEETTEIEHTSSQLSKKNEQVIAAMMMSHLKRKRRADDLTRAFLKLSGINPKMARLINPPPISQQQAISEKKSSDGESSRERVKPVIVNKAKSAESPSKAVKLEIKKEVQTVQQTVEMLDFQESLKSIKRTIMNFGKDSSESSPLTPVWDGQINLDDLSSSDDEAEIDALLATAQAVRQSANESVEQIPPTASLSRPSLFRSGSSGSYSTLGYNPTEYQPAFIPPVRAAIESNKIAERCRFWPDCRNEDICPFHHPSKPCTNFPNCWFGDKCLFLHPRCRYAPNCSKPKCPFMHTKLPAQPSLSTLPPAVPITLPVVTSTTAQKQAELGNGTERSQQVGAEPIRPAIAVPDLPLAAAGSKNGGIPCRFAGKCQNLHCTFKHPPMCRFGVNCVNGSCYFLHRKPSAVANRYKWVAPSLTS